MRYFVVNFIVSPQIKASNNLIVQFPMFGLDICLSKCSYFMVLYYGSNIVTFSSKCYVLIA